MARGEALLGRIRGRAADVRGRARTIAYYDDRPGSQQYPPPLAALYPDTGNFIAFASNVGSRSLYERLAHVVDGLGGVVSDLIR